jgi:hypothetical protein
MEFAIRRITGRILKYGVALSADFQKGGLGATNLLNSSDNGFDITSILPLARPK